MPTAPDTAQEGQIGVPHRPHDKAVSTFGCLAHCIADDKPPISGCPQQAELRTGLVLQEPGGRRQPLVQWREV